MVSVCLLSKGGRILRRGRGRGNVELKVVEAFLEVVDSGREGKARPPGSLGVKSGG
jgi:hypothetical protein